MSCEGKELGDISCVHPYHAGLEEGQDHQGCQLVAAMERGLHMLHLWDHMPQVVSQVEICLPVHQPTCSVGSALQAFSAPYVKDEQWCLAQ